MGMSITPSTLDELQDLEREMEAQGRTAKAEALRKALAALAKPNRGWITTGQAAERLGITIPTVKAWISRGVLTGRQVGYRWWISAASVDEGLGFGRNLARLEEDEPTGVEQIYEIGKQVRHQMVAEKRPPDAQE